MTGIEVRRLTTQQSDSRKLFVVGFEGERDHLNPKNWSNTTRWSLTLIISFVAFIVGLASSIDSAVLVQAANDFGISEVAESAATGLFLVGFGLGSLFAGPMSETVGRNPIYLITLSLYMIWIMASALAPNLGAQLVFRFFAGFFGSTPLTCVAGSLADMWTPLERVYTFPMFATIAFLGPILGPVIGGFIGQSSQLTWRWTEWLTLILSGLALMLLFLFQPETYAPTLLKWKAEHLRKLTGDNRFVSEIEIRAKPLNRRLLTALHRPFLLIIYEPIVILTSLYMTVVYIVLFTFLDGYTYIFADTYGFSQGMVGLAFLGIAVGLCFGLSLAPLLYRWAKRDLKRVRDQGGNRLPPETRLWYAMLAAPALPVSLFWMGWTTDSNISYWSPLIASIFFGYSILAIFISSTQYMIDTYLEFAASALVMATFMRYVVAGGMVIVGLPMYGNLGVHWTLTILGCLSLLMTPVPYCFYIYGCRLRHMSKYAFGHS